MDINRRYRKLHLRTAGVHARLSTSDNPGLCKIPGFPSLLNTIDAGPGQFSLLNSNMPEDITPSP